MKESGKVKQMYCPNCMKRLTGITDENGAMRVICERCDAKIYSKQIKPQTYMMRIRAV